MSNHSLKLNPSGGFTIVELMIATLIFSMMLIITMTAFIQIGRIFYKTLIISRTNEVARNISDDVAENLRTLNYKAPDAPQGSINSTVRYVCINNNFYFFEIGSQYISTSSDPHAQVGLRKFTATDCSASQAPNYYAQASQLLGERMRVSKFQLGDTAVASNAAPGSCPAASACQLNIRIAYGDNDLLASRSGDPAGPGAQDATCQGLPSGSEFCAVSELQTAVLGR